jgi:catechol 2,3-dioxygenase-like lactoylglutathione lyase family enzyme
VLAFQSKFLHVRIRVKDLEETIRFYTEVFGFEEIRRSTSPAGKQAGLSSSFQATKRCWS